jgi:glycosyltransferase involved in cell wall biosynthesis
MGRKAATAARRKARNPGDKMAALDVCVCTHNPRRALLSEVLAALAKQTLASGAFRVVIVDNLSSPPLTPAVLEPLKRRGVEARIVVEEQLGLTQARQRAARETNAEWICFVDDDNVLAPDYLQAAVDFIQLNPDVGAFGGKLLLPDAIKAPHWSKPFLPFLGIKDIGDEPKSALSSSWCECEPAGAGAVVHRSVMDAFCKLVRECPEAFALGRKGTGLASCDDSLLMRGSFKLGRMVAYHPKLVLEHHINPNRIKLSYLMRLMYAYGESQVLLERVLVGDAPVPEHYGTLRKSLSTLAYVVKKEWKQSPAFGLAMIGYHFSAWRAHQRTKSVLQGELKQPVRLAIIGRCISEWLAHLRTRKMA